MAVKRKRLSTEEAPTKRTKATSRAGPANKKAAVAAPAEQAIDSALLPSVPLDVFVFGEGAAGELGLGARNAIDVAAPRANPNLTGIKAIAAGGMHGVAISATNEILTWGVNDKSALGRDTAWEGGLRDVDDAASVNSDESESDLNPREATPTAIPASKFPKGFKVAQVTAGDSATFALSTDGLVYGWGTFRDRSGDEAFSLDPKTQEVIKIQSTPLLIPGLKDIVSISAGADFCLALDRHGKVYGWGCNDQHELGHKVISRRQASTLLPTLIRLPWSVKIVSIFTGINHAFGIDKKGDCWAWGLNNYGQTGITKGAGGDAAVQGPQKVHSLAGKKMKMIAAGLHHTLGLTESGECLSWGRMDGGQLGMDVATLPVNDSTSIVLDDRGKPRILLKPTPVPVPACSYIAAGTDHNIAITQEGRAYSWGFNVNYQCGQGTSDDILVAKLMNGKAIRERKLTWAGAGGQYSMLAGPVGSVLKPVTNGVAHAKA